MGHIQAVFLTGHLALMAQSCGIAYLTKLDPVTTTENLKGTRKHGLLISFEINVFELESLNLIYDCCAQAPMITRC